jgi:L,D-peptidoglycan transpeptidase YkuD (ErfK/YbiS/YcfS/YnhG family)
MWHPAGMTRRSALVMLAAAPFSAASAPALPISSTCRQLLRVETPAWNATHGTLTLWVRDSARGAWRQDGKAISVVLGRSGLRWGRGLHRTPRGAVIKKEGDGCSPAGVFSLDTAFGAMPAAKSGAARWPWTQMTAGHAGVDDPKSRHYNRVVDGTKVQKDWSRAEDMRPKGGVYRRGVIVCHNWDQHPGGGSCIFLHVWSGPRSTTAGCTAMSARDMLRVIAWLDAAKRPLLAQLPAAEWRKNSPVWGIPQAGIAAPKTKSAQPARSLKSTFDA